MSTPSELEEVLQRINAMTPQEKQDMGRRLVSAINAMVFDIVAEHQIAKRQGRDMINEQQIVQIVDNGLNILNSDGQQPVH